MAGKEVQKWADTAMFSSEPLDATVGPEVHVLSMSPDPLGEIAAATLMYQGVVIKDLADITDEQRRKAFEQIKATKLKAPFEFVKMHVLFSGVTRSWTHQLVRQRTAAYAQESLRFAVVEDGFTSRVARPPSLAGTTAVYRELAEEAKNNLAHDGEWRPSAIRESVERAMVKQPREERWRQTWDAAVEAVEKAYSQLVNDGMPAEDARGLLPHNVTTRVHYTTDLRALVDHAGNRLCTQAQFEWRTVFIKLVKAIRAFGKHSGVDKVYNAKEIGPAGHPYRAAKPVQWQYDLIADLFRPACYLTGKCEFAAQDLDRKCSIRDRVDANAKVGRPSSEWGTEHHTTMTPKQGVDLGWPWCTTKVVTAPEGGTVNVPDHPYIPRIDPREWLADPGAAR